MDLEAKCFSCTKKGFVKSLQSVKKRTLGRVYFGALSFACGLCLCPAPHVPEKPLPDHLSAFSATRPPGTQGTCLSPSQTQTDLSGRRPHPHWPFPYPALPVCLPVGGPPRALEGVGSLAPADGCSRPLSPCSTELMRRLRRFQIAQYKCLMIKYAKDTRYGDSFCTHDRSVPAPPIPAPLPRTPPGTCRQSPFMAWGNQGDGCLVLNFQLSRPYGLHGQLA